MSHVLWHKGKKKRKDKKKCGKKGEDINISNESKLLQTLCLSVNCDFIKEQCYYLYLNKNLLNSIFTCHHFVCVQGEHLDLGFWTCFVCYEILYRICIAVEKKGEVNNYLTES
jgi:hypothetical protein